MKKSSNLLSRRQFLTETSAAGFLAATVPIADATPRAVPGDPAPASLVQLRQQFLNPPQEPSP